MRTSEKTLLGTSVNKSPRGGSPSQASQASEFLLHNRVVFGAGLLAFQPLHVALQPRVVAFLGALPGKANLPVDRPLFAVGAVGQLPKLPTGLGLGDALQRGLEGLPGSTGQGLRLAHQVFLSHLLHRLFGSHGLLSFLGVRGAAPGLGGGRVAVQRLHATASCHVISVAYSSAEENVYA